MKKQTFVIIIIWLTVSCCDRIDPEIACYHGIVIMSSCCSGTSFIEMDATTPIGKSTNLMGQDFKNVIQVPGYLNNGEVFLNLRAYRQGEDLSLIPAPHCYCLISEGMDVPMWVQTTFSTNSCPMEGV